PRLGQKYFLTDMKKVAYVWANRGCIILLYEIYRQNGVSAMCAPERQVMCPAARESTFRPSAACTSRKVRHEARTLALTQLSILGRSSPRRCYRQYLRDCNRRQRACGCGGFRGGS